MNRTRWTPNVLPYLVSTLMLVVLWSVAVVRADDQTGERQATDTRRVNLGERADIGLAALNAVP